MTSRRRGSLPAQYRSTGVTEGTVSNTRRDELPGQQAPRGAEAERRTLPYASSMSSWYSRLQWSSVPSGMISTRSGFSAATAPGSCETSTTEPS